MEISAQATSTVALDGSATAVDPPAGPRRRRWLGHRGDLLVRPFPQVSGTDLASRQAAVAALRSWAEGRAEDAIEWYRRDKQHRRVTSRWLRAATILFALAGGTAPLVSAAWLGDAGGWGYVLLAAAGGCLAFDRFFGVSAGWMRDMTTIRALIDRLERFRLAWATDQLLSPGDPDADAEAELARQLALVQDFVAEVTQLVEAETSDWLAEFRASMHKLHSHAGLADRDS